MGRAVAADLKLRGLFNGLLALLAAACARPHPNVVLVSIDSLRADHLGGYGYPVPTSPSFDRIQREGAVFENVHSSTSWTLPAHCALLTALPDSVHGCIDDSRWLAPSRQTLAEKLTEEGYQTAGFYSAPYLHPAFGLGQGYKQYVDCTSYSSTSIAVIKGQENADVIALSHEDITNETVGREVTQWLRERARPPFHLFIHVWDVHADYIPPPPFSGLFDPDYSGPVNAHDVNQSERPASWSDRDVAHLVSLYDGEILWTDHLLGRLDREIERLGFLEHTILTVISDHGEAFYERGFQGHRHTLHVEETQIPLFIRYPDLLPAGTRQPDLASIIDVAPTILDLAELTNLPGAWGKSLAGRLLRSEPPEGREAIVELHVGPSQLAIRDLHTTIIKGPDGIARTYRPLDDPGEESPLAGTAVPSAPARLREIERRLAAASASMPPAGARPAIPEMTEEQLRSLGYLR